MPVREIVDLDTCLDGAFIKKIVLSSPISEGLVEYVSGLGSCEFHRDFARPFFKVQDPERFEIKGIVGNDYLRVVVYKRRPDESISLLRSFLNKYKEGL